jgi:hypothetical protein
MNGEIGFGRRVLDCQKDKKRLCSVISG